MMSNDGLYNYKVYIAGSAIEENADTPEEAAVQALQAMGWTSTRSVAIMGDGVHFEFIDPEIVGGKLQYSETSPLPEYSKVETYNRELDERNRIAHENREKPWLPSYDGE